MAFSWEEHLRKYLGDPTLVRGSRMTDDDWEKQIKDTDLGRLVPSNGVPRYGQDGNIHHWALFCRGYSRWYRRGKWWIGVEQTRDPLWAFKFVFDSPYGRRCVSIVSSNQAYNGVARGSEIRDLIKAIVEYVGDGIGCEVPICMGYGWVRPLLEKECGKDRI